MSAERTEGYIKTFHASAVIAPFRIMTFGASKEYVTPATNGTTPLIGISKIPLGSDNFIRYGQTPVYEAEAGDQIDVVMSELAEVEFGGTVPIGAWLTAAAGGKAVAITPNPAGATYTHCVGYATTAGGNGFVGVVRIAPQLILTT